MGMLLLAMALAQVGDEPTYTITVHVQNFWMTGVCWQGPIEQALGRLEGVKLAKVGKNRTYYEMTVLERKVFLPSEIAAAIPKISRYKEMTLNALAGTVEPSGEEYILAARGSNQRYILKADGALKKRMADGMSRIAVSGRVEETPEKEGRKTLPVIHVTEIKETLDK